MIWKKICRVKVIFQAIKFTLLLLTLYLIIAMFFTVRHVNYMLQKNCKKEKLLQEFVHKVLASQTVMLLVQFIH